jgi:hypothetical protein
LFIVVCKKIDKNKPFLFLFYIFKMSTTRSFPKCNILLHKVSSEILREKKNTTIYQQPLFRTISLPSVDSLSNFISILEQVDCIHYVELKDFVKVIVWINIETECSKDTRPFHYKTGIFGFDKKTTRKSYSVSLSKANELMTTGIFNIYNKINKIEMLCYSLKYNNETFVPYLICLDNE